MDILQQGHSRPLAQECLVVARGHPDLVWAASVMALLLTGCQSVSLREHNASIPARQLDGLVLATGPSATARETIAMLDIQKACSRPSLGCAEAILTAEGTVREGTRLVAASDILYQSARRGPDPGRALSRCVNHTHRYLIAPALDGRLGPLAARTQLALRLHNACTAGLLDKAGDLPSQLDWRVDRNVFPVSSVQRVVRAERLEPAGLRTRQIDDGLGVAAVAFGQTDQGQGAFPPQPFALAVNVRAEPDPKGTNVRLVVSDSSRRSEATTALGPADAARDVSAAYASAAIAFEDELSWWQGLRGPPPGEDLPRIRLLAPVDRAKTPVLLIHGLASSPMTWANLVNELQGDPDIAEHYQFWLIRYPTGLPFLYNRQQLAQVVSNFRQTAFPEEAPGDRAMIAIGHSMGGVLARLLVTNSGMALWDAAFEAGPSSLEGTPEDLKAVQELFVFSKLEGLDEVVFIAAPHRGSLKAQGAVSRVIRKLIRGPGQALNFLARLASANPKVVRPAVRENYLMGGPGSLDTLTPTQPVSAAASRLPTAPGVRVHSIIGIKDPRHREAGDGVVSLESASWPGGETHLVEGDHGVHATPKTVLIIKRILLERIERNAE